MKLIVSELDLVMLTFDEPNKELNWAHTQTIAPWSKRVDGVVGFDSAHKAAASLSDTEYLITVDGDNVLSAEFLELELEVPEQLKNHVLSWNSYNPVNGLVYGNGGVKIWPKRYIEQMRTHENSTDPAAELDFCWADTYLQLNNVYSQTNINASPLQAFRAGFREGCKMTLDRGKVVTDPTNIEHVMYSGNLTRMLIWGSIGADVENGVAAILGTRIGMWYTNILSGDISIVRDYGAFNAYAQAYINLSVPDMVELATQIGDFIFADTGIQFQDVSAQHSTFFKSCYPIHPSFSDPLVTESSVLSTAKLRPPSTRRPHHV